MTSPFEVVRLPGNIIAFALHDSHEIDPEYRPYQLLDDTARFREEDPYTSEMADLPVTRVQVRRSRFQLDLNRPREKAIYRRPEDAWGLSVWDPAFPDGLHHKLLLSYDAFYTQMESLIAGTIAEYGYCLVLDIHSYNHRREAPNQPADPATHPDINMGTAYNDPQWRPLCAQATAYLAEAAIGKKKQDCRENIIFKGGGFAQWATGRFGSAICVLSIEFKKTFMDEWTGRADLRHIQEINHALRGLLPLIRHELKQL